MLFLILKNPDDNRDSYYKGAICLHKGKPFYVTGIARPEIFKTEGQANSLIAKLEKQTEDRFMAVSVDFYLILYGKNNREPSWIAQLRQEQMEMRIDG